MNNNPVLEMIITYVEAIKKDSIIRTQYDNTIIEVHSAKYLLNQTLRQLGISQDKYLISEKAKELWDKITDKPIDKYFYQEKITCTKEGPISVDLYRGNESKSYETIILQKGDTFVYRQVFSNEHMIPINMIITALLELKELTYKNIIDIIDKIHVCRVLKEEDKQIKRKSKRSLDLDEVINIDYKDAGINVIRPL